MAILMTNQKVKFTPFQGKKEESLASGVMKNFEAIPALWTPSRSFQISIADGKPHSSERAINYRIYFRLMQRLKTEQKHMYFEASVTDNSRDMVTR